MLPPAVGAASPSLPPTLGTLQFDPTVIPINSPANPVAPAASSPLAQPQAAGPNPSALPAPPPLVGPSAASGPQPSALPAATSPTPSQRSQTGHVPPPIPLPTYNSVPNTPVLAPAPAPATPPVPSPQRTTVLPRPVVLPRASATWDPTQFRSAISSLHAQRSSALPSPSTIPSVSSQPINIQSAIDHALAAWIADLPQLIDDHLDRQLATLSQSVSNLLSIPAQPDIDRMVRQSVDAKLPSIQSQFVSAAQARLTRPGGSFSTLIARHISHTLAHENYLANVVADQVASYQNSEAGLAVLDQIISTSLARPQVLNSAITSLMRSDEFQDTVASLVERALDDPARARSAPAFDSNRAFPDTGSPSGRSVFNPPPGDYQPAVPQRPLDQPSHRHKSRQSSRTKPRNDTDSDSSSDDEDDTDTLRPKIPRKPITPAADASLKPLSTLNSLYKTSVDYRTYRLVNTSPAYNNAMGKKVYSYTRSLGSQLAHTKFDPSNGIGVLSFLSNFKRACDSIALHEGLAMWLIPHFVKGSTSQSLHSRITASPPDVANPGKLTTYCQVVQYLLRTYATDDRISEAEMSLIHFTQGPNMSVEQYANSLQDMAEKYGNVHSEDRIKDLFINGLHHSYRDNIRSYLANNPELDIHSLARYARTVASIASSGPSLKNPTPPRPSGPTPSPHPRKGRSSTLKSVTPPATSVNPILVRDDQEPLLLQASQVTTPLSATAIASLDNTDHCRFCSKPFDRNDPTSHPSSKCPLVADLPTLVNERNKNYAELARRRSIRRAEEQSGRSRSRQQRPQPAPQPPPAQPAPAQPAPVPRRQRQPQPAPAEPPSEEETRVPEPPQPASPENE